MSAHLLLGEDSPIGGFSVPIHPERQREFAVSSS
jgi:hypothetical protein